MKVLLFSVFGVEKSQAILTDSWFKKKYLCGDFFSLCSLFSILRCFLMVYLVTDLFSSIELITLFIEVFYSGDSCPAYPKISIILLMILFSTTVIYMLGTYNFRMIFLLFLVFIFCNPFHFYSALFSERCLYPLGIQLYLSNSHCVFSWIISKCSFVPWIFFFLLIFFSCFIVAKSFLISLRIFIDIYLKSCSSWKGCSNVAFLYLISISHARGFLQMPNDLRLPIYIKCRGARFFLYKLRVYVWELDWSIQCSESSRNHLLVFSSQGDKGLTTSILETECCWNSGFFQTIGVHSFSFCGSNVAPLPSNILASSCVDIFYFIFLNEKLWMFSCSWGWGSGGHQSKETKWGIRPGI